MIGPLRAFLLVRRALAEPIDGIARASIAKCHELARALRSGELSVPDMRIFPVARTTPSL